jgi:hypothetical protein
MELEAPAPRIQPINRSVIFSKEADIVLTNDAWRVILELNTSSISNALSIVREDLTITNEHKKEFTAVSELKQVEALLNTAEARLPTSINFFQKPTGNVGYLTWAVSFKNSTRNRHSV